MTDKPEAQPSPLPVSKTYWYCCGEKNDGPHAIGCHNNLEPSPSLPARNDALCADCYKEHLPIDHPCPDCQEAAKHAYSDATTPGFFHDKCSKHRKAEPLHGERSTCEHKHPLLNSDCPECANKIPKDTSSVGEWSTESVENVAFRNQNRLRLAEKKLAELGIEWEDGKGYVYNGKA